MINTIVNVSVSGGRTSAYMAWWMKENRQRVADHVGVDEKTMRYLFTFANTGMEHDDTLRFLNDVDTHLLGGELVWLEGVVMHGEKKSTRHKIVNYDTAHRASQWRDTNHPFHSCVRKYGIPDVSRPHCTREMKLNTINSYVESVTGLRRNNGYVTAIGIREDEKRRVSKSATANKIIYPLVDLNPVDKQDILDWFGKFSWDLKIPEWQGNCVTCHKKSFKKLNKVWLETPHVFDFTMAMEDRYSRVGPEFNKDSAEPDRRFYRGNRKTSDIITMFKENPADPGDYINTMEDAGCSESCELYEMEVST